MKEEEEVLQMLSMKCLVKRVTGLSPLSKKELKADSSEISAEFLFLDTMFYPEDVEVMLLIYKRYFRPRE